jgi:hypothetical protein
MQRYQTHAAFCPGALEKSELKRGGNISVINENESRLFKKKI